MDLGVWSLRNVDVCFTLLETGTPPSNVVAGDEIRKWSRVRVHHHFFPHYADQPLLFQSRDINDKRPFQWSGKQLDYILLSALSSSPNQLYYLPTKTGIPDADKQEIKRWLDWGRKNIVYLKVRRDLPDWPTPGKVDGSAHIVGDRGLVFLFNPDKTALYGEFTLTSESIGLKSRGEFSITQEHPAPGRTQTARSGETVRWKVPAQTAVVLRIQPAVRCAAPDMPSRAPWKNLLGFGIVPALQSYLSHCIASHVRRIAVLISLTAGLFSDPERNPQDGCPER
jgi:hypothetical protein